MLSDSRRGAKFGGPFTETPMPIASPVMPHTYIGPVAKLLTYGSCDGRRMGDGWPDYLELGITTEHIPELIRMATDFDLHRANQNDVKIWAPVHAWRTLGQLGAHAAAAPLTALFDKLPHDDWLAEELPTVFSMIGPASIPDLVEFLQNDGITALNRISIPRCLELIAKAHPDCRQDCVGILVRELENYATNDPLLNAFLAAGLIDLGALEAIGVMRTAFAADCVDLTVIGDIEDVEIEMGLRHRWATPPPPIDWFTGLLDREMYLVLDDYAPSVRRTKVGRNDPCPCGSGNKFKKCCLQ